MRLEATNLGDLLRIRVRLGVAINHSRGFSRAVKRARDTSKIDVLYQAMEPYR